MARNINKKAYENALKRYETLVDKVPQGFLPILDIEQYGKTKGITSKSKLIESYNDMLRKFSTASIELYQYENISLDKSKEILIPRLYSSEYKKARREAYKLATKMRFDDIASYTQNNVVFKTRQQFMDRFKRLKQRSTKTYYNKAIPKHFERILENFKEANVRIPEELEKLTLKKGGSMLSIMQYNYILTLEKNNMDDVADIILKMSPEEFYNKYKKFEERRENVNLGFVYDPLDWQNNFEYLLELWNE